MAVDPHVIGPATLSMTQALALFQNFLPKFSEIRLADPELNEGLVQDVRMGEFAAVMMTLGIGAMTSALTGSAVPSIVALVTSGGLVLLYEYALQARSGVNTDA
jgi:hypothetical protein